MRVSRYFYFWRKEEGVISGGSVLPEAPVFPTEQQRPQRRPYFEPTFMGAADNLLAGRHYNRSYRRIHNWKIYVP